MRLARGEQVAADTVIADVMPRALLQLAGEHLGSLYRRLLGRYTYGPATVKVDWALDGQIPWLAEEVRGAGTVHVGGGEDELLATLAASARGLPERPFLLLGQQSIADPSRAPEGQHTAWAYTHGPRDSVDWTVEPRPAHSAHGGAGGALRTRLPGPHPRPARARTGRPAEAQPQPRRRRCRRWHLPADQVIFRPAPSLSPYRTPLHGLYLGSSATFPGGAVHGVPGDAAANAALADESAWRRTLRMPRPRVIREQRLSVLLRWPSSWRAGKRAAGRVFLTAPAACAACTAGGNGRRLGTARCRTDARSVSMKVLVTGGTGFVGSHSVKAMLDAGHDVRLLVRSSGRVAPALEPLGVSGVDDVVGDATDAESVRRAMDGCNAVLHAAAVFSYDARDARAMQRVNTRATEVVLGASRDAGLDPIVHVSSYVALLPPVGVLDGDSPVGRPRGVYARSKAETEQMARELQGDGAPVVITYPGMVWGPHDPHLGESATLARSVLRGLVPMVPRGELPVVDVRDVAAAHAAVLNTGRARGATCSRAAPPRWPT